MLEIQTVTVQIWIVILLFPFRMAVIPALSRAPHYHGRMDSYQVQIVTAIHNFRTVLAAFTTVLRDHPDDAQLQETARATIEFLERQAEQVREASGRS